MKRLPIILAALAALAVLLESALYTVAENEQVLLTEFGKIVGNSVSTPGLHWRSPFIQDVHSFDKRWLEWDGSPNQIPTRDKKYIWIDVFARWRISDPVKFYKRMRDEQSAQSRLDDIIDGEIRNVIASNDLIDVVRSSAREFERGDEAEDAQDEEAVFTPKLGREQIQVAAKDELQKICNRYDMGIEILQLVLQDVNPPEPVRESFNEVNQAIQERERAINQAWANYNSVIPEAKGKAEQQIQNAEGYGLERVNNAHGDVQRFVALQTEYEKAPAVTHSRLYLEAIGESLPKARHRVIVDSNVKGVLPLYGLGLSPEGAKP
jgi:membrane protease subunit HflC